MLVFTRPHNTPLTSFRAKFDGSYGYRIASWQKAGEVGEHETVESRDMRHPAIQ